MLPLAPDVPVQILGNIDRELHSRAPGLYKAHAASFRGRVGDLHDAYRSAAAVLLPATAGHGISIKTIEALSCGAPLIATPLAFRGLGIDTEHLPNVTVAETAPLSRRPCAVPMRNVICPGPTALRRHSQNL